MRTIPLDAGRFLFLTDASAWVLREAEGGEVRALNSDEVLFVKGAIEAATARALRDTIAARQALDDCTRAWREAIGVGPEHCLASVTRGLVARDHRGALGLARLLRAGQLSRVPSVANWDAENLGRARGLEEACAVMEGRVPRGLTEPLVWGRDRAALRGRYRLARAERMSVLGAAVVALFGWLAVAP